MSYCDCLWCESSRREQIQPYHGMRVAFISGDEFVGHRTLYLQNDDEWHAVDEKGRTAATFTTQELVKWLNDGIYRPAGTDGCNTEADGSCSVRPGAWLNALSSAERKEAAMARGLLAYFPDALALVARHSVRMNEKHNPGEPVHWSRNKSTDHDDCVTRHSANIANDPDSKDGDGAYHVVCRAWRALAALQVWTEAKHAKGEKI